MGAATRGTRVAWDAGPVATRRGDAVMAAVVAFFIAMPYPGLAIGSNTGLTLGHVFSFLALALAFARRSRVVPLVSWITGLAVLPLLTSQPGQAKLDGIFRRRCPSISR